MISALDDLLMAATRVYNKYGKRQGLVGSGGICGRRWSLAGRHRFRSNPTTSLWTNSPAYIQIGCELQRPGEPAIDEYACAGFRFQCHPVPMALQARDYRSRASSPR